MVVALVIFSTLAGLALLIIAAAVGLRIIHGPISSEDDDNDDELTADEKKVVEEGLNKRLVELQQTKFAPPSSRATTRRDRPAQLPGISKETVSANALSFNKKNKGEK